MTSKMLYWIPVLMFNFSVVAHAGIVTFTDYNAFLAAAGDVHVIDFETLPDGSPSAANTPITPVFNYTNQGVTFSSPFPELFIRYFEGGDTTLSAFHADDKARNWIIADLVTPASAVGIFFPGDTALTILDIDEQAIMSIEGGGSGSGFFLGIISDVPISSAIGDRGASAEIWESFVFTPVPEPGTIILLTVGAAVVVRRRKYSRHYKY